jgi:23S rRNA (adenine2503-C2)-methyltransferase
MDLELLDHTLAANGQPPFRARQVWEWAAKGAAGYEVMTNLPAPLREWLREAVPFSSLELQDERTASDGTVKALFATGDGRPIEAVLMRYRDGRRSICVSSQSGCPLTCKFCATGQMKFGRNLTASEIVEQALHFRRAGTIDHCVFMGMGEPMLNLEGVLAACERLPDVGITHRRTAISTVGWIPGIERLTECEMPLRLALSLHAADDALRSELMPVNERYPLADVIEACRAFYERKRRRVFVEYVMLAGVNDRYEQALALARLLEPRGPGTLAGIPNRAYPEGTRQAGEQPHMFKVNLIPYNPTGGHNPASPARPGLGPHPTPHPAGPGEGDPYQGSSRESIAAFKGALEARGVPATVRLTRGRDIDAACGQLAARRLNEVPVDRQ